MSSPAGEKQRDTDLVTFMCVMAGGAPRDAWDQYQRMVVEDEQLRALIRRLHERRDPMLDESRGVWRGRGFDRAPFDFLFDEEEARR